MLNLVVLDDEKWALADIANRLERFSGVKVMKQYLSALEALQNMDCDIASGANVYFCDISMSQLCGMDFAKYLHEKYPQVRVVFVTASEQYALKAFDVNAADYLLKPVEAARLRDTISRLKEELCEGVSEICEEITLFGRFDWKIEGRPIKWLSRKAEELTACLAAHAGRPVRREKLYELIWNKPFDNNGAGNLQTTVFRARQSLDGCGSNANIILHDNTYRLVYAHSSCDCDVLEKKIKSLECSEEEINACLKNGFLSENGWMWAYAFEADWEAKLLQYCEKRK